MTLSLHTLPVELVYRILDNLDDHQIFLSCINVCVRLNVIIDTYDRYKVIFDFIMKLYLHHLWSISFISVVYIISMTFLLPDLKGIESHTTVFYLFIKILSIKRIQEDTHTHYQEFLQFMIVYEILNNIEQSKHIFQRPCGYWFSKDLQKRNFS